MAKNKKSVQIGVFHILKSVMDAKAKPLKNLAAQGRRAIQEEAVINERLGNLYNYIAANRHDRETVRDAEYDIAEYEAEAAVVRQYVMQGEQAKQELEHVERFNKTYNKVVGNDNQIAKLQDDYRNVEDRIAKLDERIFACQINMNPDERDAETVADAEHDIEYYQAEYNDMVAKRNALENQIAQLKKQK